ncbi:MAG: TetR family transcriptional regulator [Actinobacteria bacterium]|nr:TetR family transcriptional regulator [Actinomycetota bacterium]
MTTTRTSSRHAGLDRDDVIDAALLLVDEGGPEALTMRRLAGELGVATTTIYWHVGSRDDVVDAVIRRHAERLGRQAASGDTPRRRVMSVARHLWDGALAHRGITRLAELHGGASVLNEHLEVAMARELTAVGVVGDDARDALRAILICVGGFLVLALRDERAITPERSRTAVWSRVEDPDVDPSTRRALTTQVDLPALFERTVQAVVDTYVPAR